MIHVYMTKESFGKNYDINHGLPKDVLFLVNDMTISWKYILYDKLQKKFFKKAEETRKKRSDWLYDNGFYIQPGRNYFKELEIPYYERFLSNWLNFPFPLDTKSVLIKLSLSLKNGVLQFETSKHVVFILLDDELIDDLCRYYTIK